MKEKGFTLIELLVVIAIIGVLTGIGVNSFQRSQAGARDAQRRADMKQIQSALEIYKSDKGFYPCPVSGLADNACNWQSALSLSGSAWIQKLVPAYMTKLPLDPKNAAGYFYDYIMVCDGQDYVLGVNLELPSSETGKNVVAKCGGVGSSAWWGPTWLWTTGP